MTQLIEIDPDIVAVKLEEMAKLYRSKQKEYGANWLNELPTILGLFYPNKTHLENSIDSMLHLIGVKLSRMATSYCRNGIIHPDSICDLTVYSVMLGVLNEMKSNLRKENERQD